MGPAGKHAEAGPKAVSGRRACGRLDRSQKHTRPGCTLSAAIAALIPQRARPRATAPTQLAEAVGMTSAHGHGPVHHFHQLWPLEDKDN